MAIFLQRNAHCSLCDKTYENVMVPESSMKFLCRECGNRCDILDKVGVKEDIVSHKSRSYKFGKHIDNVKEMRYNVAKSVKK